MNCTMKKTIALFLLLCFLTIAGVGKIQPACSQPTNCIPGEPDYDEDLCAPVDGFVSVLLLAGVGYGVIKNRPSRKNEKPNNTAA